MSRFQNESGAFDLPSILVGVVVVGILTAGVLAALFGVIPFAQDKAAHQDLDATRTAEGVAKAKDGRYLNGNALKDAELLSNPGSTASDTDPSGTCYVGIAKSGSGKLYYSSSASSTPQELTSATTTGCVSTGQRDAMIAAVGGSPFPGSAAGGVTFTPIAARSGVDSAVTSYMNAELAGYYGSPLLLAAAQSYSDADWNAWENSPEGAAYIAADDALRADSRLDTQYKNLTQSTAVADLYATTQAAETEFWDSPTLVTQQAWVDAWLALYNSGISVPDTQMVATSTDPDAYSNITIAAGENFMIYRKATLPDGVDMTDSATFQKSAISSLPANSYYVTGDGAPYWKIGVDAGKSQWTAGTYTVKLRVTDTATNLLYYRDFTITVTP